MIKKEIENTKAEAQGGAVMVLVWAFFIFLFLGSQGCASRTGWEFRIGVAPVTAVDNSSKLQQDEQGK